GKEFPTPEESMIHQMAEMPLNHLGLVVEYHDVRKPLPDLTQRPDVRGILSWYRSENPISDLPGYVTWATNAIDRGKKFVVMGVSGLSFDEEKEGTKNKIAAPLLARIGLANDQCSRWKANPIGEVSCGWVDNGYFTSYPTKDAKMVEFERKF